MAHKKELEQRVVVRKTELPNEKEFHGRIQLNTFPEDYCCKDYTKYKDEKEYPNCFLAELLFEIEGMQEVYINGYVITVSISAAFSWRELEVRILESIKAYLRTKILESKMGENKKR